MANKLTQAQKIQRLSIRVSEPEKALLIQAAQARRMNVSQFVLQTSLDAAQAILAEQNQFRLTPQQWERFCQHLEAPPKVIPALAQLFSEPDPFEA